jgi:hypothetical protein
LESETLFRMNGRNTQITYTWSLWEKMRVRSQNKSLKRTPGMPVRKCNRVVAAA